MQKVECSTSTFGFEMTPAPSVEALCFIPRIDYGEMIEFLIDTGADSTCLNGIYGLDLQGEMLQDTLDDSAIGVGGPCGYFHEKAIIVFEDTSGELIGKEVVLGVRCIQEEEVENEDVLATPCLIGRDIINESAFHFEFRIGNVELFF